MPFNIKSLIDLKEELSRCDKHSDAKQIRYLIKKCSLPGVDVPADEIEIDGIEEALSYLEANKGMFIFLDNPKGSRKKFGDKKIKMPFHYGEFTEIINPSDDMGWDLIIVPSASGGNVKHVKAGHDLEPIGYVPVNLNEETWAKQTSTAERPKGKKPPAGNDKIILSPNKEVRESDLSAIEDFFSNMWQFEEVVWL